MRLPLSSYDAAAKSLKSRGSLPGYKIFAESESEMISTQRATKDSYNFLESPSYSGDFETGSSLGRSKVKTNGRFKSRLIEVMR